MKKLVLLLLIAATAHGANHYVRASGDVTNNGDGSTWGAAASTGAAGAMKGFPATLVRGDTYYFAGGSYGAFTFTTATSGTTRVTVKKATVADHGGQETGWSDTYGTTQAGFTHVYIDKGYLTFDGATGGGPGSWTSGFGVLISVTSATSGPGVNFGYSSHANTDSCIIRHFEVVGNGGDGVQSGNENDGLISWASTNLLVEYAYIHDMGRTIFLNVNNGTTSNNNTIQYCYTGDYEYVGSEHSEVASMAGDNWTFRWNIFTVFKGTGGLMVNGSGMKVYGNIFYHPASVTNWDYASNGLIGSKDSGEDPNPVFVYNNTFYNCRPNDTSNAGQFYGGYLTATGGIGVGSTARNNLYYGTGIGNFGQINHSHNQYHALSQDTEYSSMSETGKTTGTGNPFTNVSALDFSLTANTTAGVDLGAPYNVDMLGNTRTTWTRGAIEFAAATPPSNLIVRVRNAKGKTVTVTQ